MTNNKPSAPRPSEFIVQAEVDNEYVEYFHYRVAADSKEQASDLVWDRLHELNIDIQSTYVWTFDEYRNDPQCQDARPEQIDTLN